MARKLDSKYFRLLDARVEGPFEYQSYQCIIPTATMILFSKVDPTAPIAGLSFFPRARGGNAKTVISRRAEDALPPTSASKNAMQQDENQKSAFFHGLTNVDNEEFTFAIHNFTDFVSQPHLNIHAENVDKNNVGYMKIDILAHDIKVTEVDMPTLAVNQVNEIRPSESYLIEADQRTGNKTMVLRGAVDEQTGRAISVEKDEADAKGKLNEKTKGTYFYINVVASAAFPAMVGLLKDSAWRAVDVFTRRIPKDNGSWQNYSLGGRVQTLSLDANQEEEETDFDDYVFSASQEVPQREYYESSRGITGNLQGRTNRSRGGQSYGSRSLNYDRDRRDSSSFGDRSRSVHTFAMASASAPVPIPKGKTAIVACTPKSAEIKGAQAGQVVQGSQSVSVSSSQTGLLYNFETCGERVCLGLAVWKDMRTMVRLTEREALQEAKMQMQDAIVDHGKALLQSLSKIYKQDTCAVCLTNEPNIVFFQCGHSCLCSECLAENTTSSSSSSNNNRCYLCRAPIAARIASSVVNSI